MSVHKVGRGYVVRWRDGDRNRQQTFDRKKDADRWETEVRRRRQLGTLHEIDAGRETLDEYVTGTWAGAHAAALAPKTRAVYSWAYDAHIAPRLGGLALHELTPDVLARFQSDLIAAGAGHAGTDKAMTLLGGILQRAAESRRIPYNPARLVRKAPAPLRQEVRPLAPATVERMRAAMGQRDATVISVLAYAGLRPQELRGLRWGHVGERTLVVGAPKTHSRRSVRLLEPLAHDLREWRMACGRPADDVPVFLGRDGGPWTAEGFNKWRAGRARKPKGPRWGFAKALDEAGVERARPYDLRHSFASLLLHEGRSVIYVARQLGHGAEQTMRTYGHVIDELEDAPRVTAEDAIRATRTSGRDAQVG
jgi:integrase